MAISAVAAVASAGAVAEGIIAVETLATISAVVGVVGVVTGSKELSSLAMGMGVASLGSSLLSSAGTAGQTATTAATQAGEGATQAATAASENLAGPALDAGVGGGLDAGSIQAADLSSVQGAVPDASSSLVDSGSQGIIQGAQTSQPVADIPSSAQAVPPQTSSNLDVSSPSGPSDVSAPSGPQAPASPADQLPNETAKLAQQNIGAPAFQDSKSFLGGVLDWAEKNKTLTSGIMNLGGGLLSGVGKAYEADRNYQINRDLVTLKQQEAKNANAQPTVTVGVNQNANVFNTPQRQYAGIINSRRA